MNVRRDSARVAAVAVVAAAALTLPAGVAGAHESRRIGDHEVVVGWSNEPAYASFGNEVQIAISHGKEPVEDAELEAVVGFGGEDAEVTTDPMPLQPAFGEPGVYLGYMIPTRPGTYTFHITGMVEGEAFDETFTSGPDTFSDIENPTAVEFPEQDPTRGEVAERVDRLDARIQELGAQAPADEGGDPLAMWIAIGAAVVALIALVLAARRRPA